MASQSTPSKSQSLYSSYTVLHNAFILNLTSNLLLSYLHSPHLPNNNWNTTHMLPPSGLCFACSLTWKSLPADIHVAPHSLSSAFCSNVTSPEQPSLTTSYKIAPPPTLNCHSLFFSLFIVLIPDMWHFHLFTGCIPQQNINSRTVGILPIFSIANKYLINFPWD